MSKAHHRIMMLPWKASEFTDSALKTSFRKITIGHRNISQSTDYEPHDFLNGNAGCMAKWRQARCEINNLPGVAQRQHNYADVGSARIFIANLWRSSVQGATQQ